MVLAGSRAGASIAGWLWGMSLERLFKQPAQAQLSGRAAQTVNIRKAMLATLKSMNLMGISWSLNTILAGVGSESGHFMPICPRLWCRKASALKPEKQLGWSVFQGR